MCDKTMIFLAESVWTEVEKRREEEEKGSSFCRVVFICLVIKQGGQGLATMKE